MCVCVCVECFVQFFLFFAIITGSDFFCFSTIVPEIGVRSREGQLVRAHFMSVQAIISGNDLIVITFLRAVGIQIMELHKDYWFR